MKAMIAAALAALCVGIARAEKIPASAFARSQAYHDVQISPDGKYVGCIAATGDQGTKHVLLLIDLATGAKKVIDAPMVWSDHENIEEVLGFYWLTDKRLVFRYSRPDTWHPMPGIAAVDRDGQGFRDFPGLTGIFFVPGHSIHYLQLGAAMARTRNHPVVYDVDTRPGRTANIPQGVAGVTRQDVHLVVDDSEEVNAWVPDREGNIRLGISYDGDETRVIYRPDDDSPWQHLTDFDCKGLGGYPMAVDWDGRTAYAAALTPAGTWGVASYDLGSRKRGPLVASDEVYDILSPNDYMVSRSYLLFSRRKHKLVGISYPASAQRTVWLDPEFAGVQAAMNRALPGMINGIWNWSDDETKILVHSYSDRSPGAYYLFDGTAHSLRKLFDVAPWIVPARMGKVYPISYRSHDGLLVHGYLTAPAGAAPKNLPLVFLTRPELYFTRSAEGFRPFAQFLASRGYAVLEINPRGSPGYGKAFYDAGKGQVGRGVQDDIAEGVRWAVARGIADPRRIAIYGTAFGGYAAELAITQTPDLYRCAISADAICDMPAYLNAFETGVGFVQKAGASATSERRAYIRDRLGNADLAALRDISPISHVDRIRAPILLISHKTDRENLANQTDRFESALKAAHATYERKDFAIHRSNLETLDEQVEYFNLLDDFLARNMK
jgi:dienelactone hydrolase